LTNEVRTEAHLHNPQRLFLPFGLRAFAAPTFAEMDSGICFGMVVAAVVDRVTRRGAGAAA